MNPPNCRETEFNNQTGGGILSIVAVLGGVIMLVQGSVYYRAKTGAAFLGAEKGKVLAMQMAEAGVEENIADIGNRTLRIRAGMPDTVTYDRHSLGSGTFTSTLRPVAMGALADTVDLTSTGSMGKGSYSVQARLRLRNQLDTNRQIDTSAQPITTTTFVPQTVSDTTIDTTEFDPSSMPSMSATPAYTACMGSPGNQCDLCHLPPGNPGNVQVIRVGKNAINNAHVPHHGDYISTDGTCDLYKPQISQTITTNTIMVPVVTVTNQIVFDTVIVVDTIVRVQVLSWK